MRTAQSLLCRAYAANARAHLRWYAPADTCARGAGMPALFRSAARRSRTISDSRASLESSTVPTFRPWLSIPNRACCGRSGRASSRGCYRMGAWLSLLCGRLAGRPAQTVIPRPVWPGAGVVCRLPGGVRCQSAVPSHSSAMRSACGLYARAICARYRPVVANELWPRRA